MSKTIIGLIPSRLASTRLPNKALLEIRGLPLIAHTLKRAQLAKSLSDVFVCTDSEEIAEAVSAHGGKAIFTSKEHTNGTERIAEAARNLQADLFVDIQGDEPLIDPDHIDAVVAEHERILAGEGGCSIVLPCLRIDSQQAQNPHIVKVVRGARNQVIYLSRAPVPAPFRGEADKFWKHLSIISFTPEALQQFARTPVARDDLEATEGVELLRAVEHGIPIHTIALEGDSFSVDMLEDYYRAVQQFKTDKTFDRYGS